MLSERMIVSITTQTDMNGAFKLTAAPFTPFHEDGEINVDLVLSMAGHLKRHGVHAAFVNGTTGEYSSLTMDERCLLTEAWMDAGREHELDIMVHVGANSLSDCVKLTSHAASCGADAISAVAPSYLKPERLPVLVDWMSAIAAEAPDCPFYYYHIPGLTGVNFSMSEFLREGINQIPNLKGIKFSAIQPAEILECLQRFGDSHEIYYGNDESVLSGLALGVHGAIGSTYNFMAPVCWEMIKAFKNGDLASAQKWQYRSLSVVNRLFQSGYLASAKALMKQFGLDCGDVRLPLESVSNSSMEQVLEELMPQFKELGLLA
jgi:N-acetylneuraminate lyase